MAGSSLPKTARAAKKLGAKYYFTGKPCKRGHVDKRHLTGACVACTRERNLADREAHYLGSAKWREANREYLRQKQRQYYRANAERCQATNRAWAKANPECAKESERRRREKLLADPAALEARREIARRWHRQFPEKQSAATRRRKLAKIERTPTWLTADQRAEMTAFYAEAVRLSRETGITHEVDHIIPLQGENVCGLHVPWNLQILTAEANRSKGNKHAD
jgi:hypothetical protein